MPQFGTSEGESFKCISNSYTLEQVRRELKV